MHLCEASESEMLDCGGLSALTLLAWQRRCDQVIPVQLVQRYPLDDCRHWSSSWDQASIPCTWIADDLVYHEAVGVLYGKSLRIWDPTEESFIEPTSNGSYGSVVGLRASTKVPLTFGSHPIAASEWAWLNRSPNRPPL
jgi:hypothetical protein